MPNPKPSFLKSIHTKKQTGPWYVSVTIWQTAADGTLRGDLIDEVETNDLNLAALAAHHMIDEHGASHAQMLNIEITVAEWVDGI